MKTIGNILWLVFGGIVLAFEWLLIALLLTITIVGIPFAVQCLKLSLFSLWPFGREAVPDPDASTLGVLGAVLWLIPGLIICVSYLASGLLLCITIIGIPFGIQAFKLAGLALAPFGKRIVKIH